MTKSPPPEKSWKKEGRRERAINATLLCSMLLLYTWDRKQSYVAGQPKLQSVIYCKSHSIFVVAVVSIVVVVVETATCAIVTDTKLLLL